MDEKKCIFYPNISCPFINNQNIIKTRDDAHPLCFVHNVDGKYSLCEHHRMYSWCESTGDFDEQTLRERIEPWLTALFQSEHLSLLTGSGLTIGICQIADQSAAGMPQVSFTNFNSEIDAEVKRSAIALGRAEGNFEDYIRVANALYAGLKILGNPEAEPLGDEIAAKLNLFTESLLASEEALASSASQKREDAFNCLVSFLMSFASRTGTRDRVHIFTTNYDRLIEEAADLAGLHLLDRFIGKLSPVFRSSRLNLDLHYNPPGIRGEPRYLEGVARFTKLHGSLDWVKTGSLIRRVGIPFGVKDITPYLQAPGFDGVSAFDLMIYPNSAKDRETADYPYVELFRDFAAAICRPNSTVVTYGYSFGDEHINRILRDMLTIPSTHLVIISYDDRLGRIHNFYSQTAHLDQISLLMGSDIASIDNLTRKFLPKSAIDFATSRMGEILQSRYASQPRQESHTPVAAAKATLLPGGQQ